MDNFWAANLPTDCANKYTSTRDQAALALGPWDILGANGHAAQTQCESESL
jgi:hypothetical protein